MLGGAAPLHYSRVITKRRTDAKKTFKIHVLRYENLPRVKSSSSWSSPAFVAAAVAAAPRVLRLGQDDKAATRRVAVHYKTRFTTKRDEDDPQFKYHLLRKNDVNFNIQHSSRVLAIVVAGRVICEDILRLNTPFITLPHLPPPSGQKGNKNKSSFRELSNSRVIYLRLTPPTTSSSPSLQHPFCRA